MFTYMRRISLLLLLLLTISYAALAQSFTAKIEDVGGYYRLTFTVSSSGASNFAPPSLAAFDVLSGPNTSTFSSYQMVNGHASHAETTSYTYILSAKKGGKLTIGSASIRVGGRTLRSRPVTFSAHAGSAGTSGTQGGGGRTGGGSPQTGHDLQQAGSSVTGRDLFIDVTPSRTRVREQEAVLLTYRIHSRVGVGLANTQLTSKPDFKGLISQEIPLPGNQIQTNIEHRNGTTYRTGTILQYVIFPQQSGRLSIPSITFDCTVIQQDHSMDLADAFFNGGGNIGVQVRRTVPITSIQVEALPQPKPAGFSGAVGKFSMEGKVLNGEVKTNDVATYRITLNGLGNLKLITAPKVDFPKDFDSYDAKTNDNTRITANGLTGQLTFDYTFVPRNVGKYTIPAISFVYFDTESGAYRTIKTQAITLDVKKGARSNADVDKQLALLRSDIHDIHPTGKDSGSLISLSWGQGGYWLALAFICLAFGAAFYFLRRFSLAHADLAYQRSSKASKRAVQRLREAEKLINAPQAADFYAAVSKAVMGYLADKFNVAQADLNRENISSMLREKGTPEETIQNLLKVIETCEYAQYAPGAQEQRRQVYEQALQLFSLLKH